jgi:hypothetical protein
MDDSLIIGAASGEDEGGDRFKWSQLLPISYCIVA